MKKLRELCAAMMLLTLLSLSVRAGEISTGVVSPPPPPPASATATEPGHITTGEIAGPSTLEANTLLTEITMSLLQLLSAI